MKAWLLAAISGAPELVTQTFTSNTTWTAPLFVNTLPTLTGKGAPGQPEDEDYIRRYSYQFIGYKTRRSDGSVASFPSPKEYRAGTPAGSFGTFCTGKVATPSDPNYSDTWTCETYEDESYWDYDPPTTGASTTAFGKTFPGGYGGAAAPTTHSNVAVIPGQSYSLVIPAGGSITLSYYR